MIIIIIAGPLFLFSLAAHLFVKIAMRPRDRGFDDYHYEFEDHHPQFARYSKWSQITFTAAVIAAILLFIAISI